MSQSELTADFRIYRKFWFLVPISKGGKCPFFPPCGRPWSNIDHIFIFAYTVYEVAVSYLPTSSRKEKPLSSGVTDGGQGCAPPPGRLNVKDRPLCWLVFRYLVLF